MAASSNPIHHDKTTVSGTGTELGFIELVGRTDRTHARFQLGEHDHGSAYEICYLRRGSQTFVVEGTRHTIRGGEFFITYPGERHGSGDEPLEKSLLYWMIIDPTAPVTSIESEGALAMIMSVLQRLKQGKARTALSATRAETHFDAIFSAWEEPAGVREARIVQAVLAISLAMMDASVASGHEDISSEIKSVVSAIRGAPERRIGLDELGQIAGLSASQLRARFEAELGMPPSEFANRVRVEEAKIRLRAGDTVTDVAFTLGFPSSQYFATVFKQFTGQTPSEFGP